MDYKLHIGGCGMNTGGCCCTSNKKLSVHDWLSTLPESVQESDFVEVQFKNTRKGYYLNNNKTDIYKGDLITVEASPGHDIGEVTLTGKLVILQMKKNNIDFSKFDVKKIYRKVSDVDMEKYNEAKSKEQQTMIKARQIAESLKLNMKIGDVEYQGDGNKAIFYYIADERVDFRQLIKVFAETFRIRIEMKQIGARQEAGRIGGIGPCGRELCCSKWMTNFSTVSTGAARIQDLSLNPQKLAGQCAKLKCCMNYELDTYVDASKNLPSKEINLETKDAIYYHFKTEVFKETITYSTSPNFAANLVTISADRAKEIIKINSKGQKPIRLGEDENDVEKKTSEYKNVVGQDSLTRFDTNRKKRNNNNRNNNGKGKKQQGRNKKLSPNSDSKPNTSN